MKYKIIKYLRKVLEIIKLEQEIAELKGQSKVETEVENASLTFDEFTQLMTDEVDLAKPKIDRSVLEKLIHKIVPNTSQAFKWYLNLLPHKNDSEYIEAHCFTIRFQEARDYRRMRHEMLRENQWRDLIVRILI